MRDLADYDRAFGLIHGGLTNDPPNDTVDDTVDGAVDGEEVA